MLPAPRVRDVARRAWRWGRALARWTAAALADRAAGRATDTDRGRRLRRLLEDVGGPAIKLGQQLSMRVDLLPWGVCAELVSLVDDVPAFPVAEALPALTAAFGRPPEAVLAALDPTPIGAASLAVVWQAELKDGRRVALKVRRPGIEYDFAADLAMLGGALRVAEVLALVRPGHFRWLRQDLADILGDELDLRLEARNQRVFRAAAIRDREAAFEVPAVFDDLSDDAVLVSELVVGVSCSRVLALSGSDAGRARLAERDIDPVRVARHLQRLAFWSQHQAPLFHADLHPGNLIVLPGSRLAVLDFGACGTIPDRTARLGRRVVTRLRARDPAAAADVAMVQSAPYPPMDTGAYRSRLHRTFLRWHEGGQDPGGPWWARSTALVWLGATEAARRHSVPVQLNTLRMIRATLLYDTLVCRLDPHLPTTSFRAWLRRAWRRRLRRDARGLRQPAAEGAEPNPREALARLAASTDRLTALAARVRRSQAPRRWLRPTPALATALAAISMLLAPASGLAWVAAWVALAAWTLDFRRT